MATDKWLAKSFLDKRRAYVGCKMLEILHQGGDLPGFQDEVMQQDGFIPLASRRMRPGQEPPNAYCCRTGELTHLFIGGLITQSECQRVWNDYRDSRWTLPNGNVYTGVAAEYAAQVISKVVDGVWDGGRLNVYAHSFGGCVMLPLFRTLFSRVPDLQKYEFISYGSPKPEGTGGFTSFPSYFHARYVNNDDPVPLFPYDPGVWSQVMFWGGTNARARLAAFVHGNRCIEITGDGTTSVQERPRAAAANPSSSIQAWLSASGAGQVTAHSISSYRFRLTQPADAPPAPSVGQVPGNLAVQAIPSGPELASVTQNVVNTILTDSSVRAGVPVVIPDTRLFHVAHVKPLWHVLFGGVEVATSLNKKRARGLARIGNDFLRRLQRQEIVLTDDMASQFLAYLAAASDPTSGILPTLNPGIPGS